MNRRLLLFCTAAALWSLIWATCTTAATFELPSTVTGFGRYPGEIIQDGRVVLRTPERVTTSSAHTITLTQPRFYSDQIGWWTLHATRCDEEGGVHGWADLRLGGSERSWQPARWEETPTDMPFQRERFNAVDLRVESTPGLAAIPPVQPGVLDRRGEDVLTVHEDGVITWTTTDAASRLRIVSITRIHEFRVEVLFEAGPAVLAATPQWSPDGKEFLPIPSYSFYLTETTDPIGFALDLRGAWALQADGCLRVVGTGYPEW